MSQQIHCDYCDHVVQAADLVEVNRKQVLLPMIYGKTMALHVYFPSDQGDLCRECFDAALRYEPPARHWARDNAAALEG